MEEVVGLVSHEELGAVCRSEDDGSFVAEASYAYGIVRWDVAAMEEAADLAAVAGGGDRRFDGDGEAGEFAGARVAGLFTDAIGVEVDKGVEDGVEAFDAEDVFFGELQGGDLAVAEELELIDGGEQGEAHAALPGVPVTEVEGVRGRRG